MNLLNERLVILIFLDFFFMKYMYDFSKREKIIFMVIFFFMKWKYVKIINSCFYIYRDLLYGKGVFIFFKDIKIVNIEKIEFWDGKDGEVNKKILMFSI